MNLHPLSPDFPYPSCGAGKMSFAQMDRYKADLYFCQTCGCYVAHRRPKGQSYCETAIWEYAKPRRCRESIAVA